MGPVIVLKGYLVCYIWCLHAYKPRYIETGMLLFIDRVAADFFCLVYCRIGRSWDFLVGTVWLHLFLCLHDYMLTGK